MSSVNMSHNCTSNYYCGAPFPFFFLFSLLAKRDREGRITEQALSRDVCCILPNDSIIHITERPIQGVNPTFVYSAQVSMF